MGDVIDVNEPETSLAEAAARARRDPRGVRRMLGTIHRDLDLASRVRLETVALAPMLWRDGDAVRATSLLVDRLGTGKETTTPWGTVTWSWPGGAVVDFSDWGVHRPAGLDAGRWLLPGDAGAINAALDRIDLVGDDPSVEQIADVNRQIDPALPDDALVWYRAALAGKQGLPTQGAVAPRPSAARQSARDMARAVEAIAERVGLDDVAERIRSHRFERDRPGSRLVVVGEFNRGKSTLINMLLGSDVVPTGATPVTRAFVVIGAADHGSPPSLAITWPDGRRERRALDGEQWRGLTLTEDPQAIVVGEGQGAESEPRLVLTIDAPWLRSTELELIDTPGTNEGRIDRVLQTRRAVALSDVVVMTVSATSPLSMTEQALLHDEVLARHVPRVVVVVTMLDRLPPGECDEVFDVVAARVHAVSPSIVVLRAPGVVDSSGGHVEALRRTIEDLTTASGRPGRRDRRLAAQVADECRVVLHAVDAAREQARRDDAARADALAAAEQDVQQADADWNQLRLDLGGQQAKVATWLRTTIRSRSDDLFEALDLELARSTDPKTWWERDLPVRLRRELIGLTKTIESDLAAALQRDAVWLDKQVARRFEVSGPRAVKTSVTVTAPDRTVELVDLGQRRMLSRIAAAGGGIIGGVLAFVSGFGMPFVFTFGGSAVAGLLGEKTVNEATVAQRHEVSRHLRAVVDDSVRQYLDQLDRELARSYQTMLADLGSIQRSWRRSQLAALRAADESPSVDWEQAASEVSALLHLLATSATPTREGTEQ